MEIRTKTIVGMSAWPTEPWGPWDGPHSRRNSKYGLLNNSNSTSEVKCIRTKLDIVRSLAFNGRTQVAMSESGKSNRSQRDKSDTPVKTGRHSKYRRMQGGKKGGSDLRVWLKVLMEDSWW